MCQGKNKEIISNNSISKIDKLVEINIDTLDVQTPILFSSIFNGFKLIPLETKEECLIGRISMIEIRNDTIYILDSSVAKSIFLFNKDGKFIRRIGRIGKGPGEYIQPAYFSINYKKNQILILDNKQKKIIIFSSTGSFINEIKLKNNLLPLQIAVQNELIYIDQLNSKFMNAEYLLYAIDNSGKIKSQWLRSQTYQQGFKQPVNNSFNFFISEKDIKYVKPFFDTIFSINGTCIKPYIHISTTNKISKEDMAEINNFKDIKQYFNYARRCDKFLGITDYIESNTLTMFKFRNHIQTNNLFYWHSNKEINCTTKFTDDLTLTANFTQFYCVYKNQFVSCIQNVIPETLENFVVNVAEKRINLTEKERFTLKKLNSNSNPIVVLYECRKEIDLH